MATRGLYAIGPDLGHAGEFLRDVKCSHRSPGLAVVSRPVPTATGLPRSPGPRTPRLLEPSAEAACARLPGTPASLLLGAPKPRSTKRGVQFKHRRALPAHVPALVLKGQRGTQMRGQEEPAWDPQKTGPPQGHLRRVSHLPTQGQVQKHG